MTTETMMARALDTLMMKEEDEEIGQVFALKCDYMDSSDQSKRYGVIYHKIIKTKVKIIEEDLCHEIEDKVLQIFLCEGIANMKIEANTSKNEEEGITTEAKVFEYEVNNLQRNNCEALIAYIHLFWIRATTET